MQSKILKFGLAAHAVAASVLCFLCLKGVSEQFLTGDIFRSSFGFDVGVQYAVFNVMSNVIALVAGLFGVLLCLAGFSRLVAWFTGMDVYHESSPGPRFYKKPSFWAVTAFSVAYAVLYLHNMSSMTAFEFSMIDNADATILLAVLFGPLLAVVFFGLALAACLGLAIMFAASLSWVSLVRYVKDVVMSCDPAYVRLMRTYDEDAVTEAAN